MEEEKHKDPRENVLEALRTKACMKQDVYARITELFDRLKEDLVEVAKDL